MLTGCGLNVGISIHAPLRERLPKSDNQHSHQNFNPRSLAGATSNQIKYVCPHCDFNPRSLAGATAEDGTNITCLIISIHAPLRERPLL